MKKFLAIYVGSEASLEKSGWNALTDQQRQVRQAAGMEAWKAWGASHHRQIQDYGGPLGKTLRAGLDGINATKNTSVGYVIVEAETHEAAASLFVNHPHFTMFPGDSVEIMECLPVPSF